MIGDYYHNEDSVNEYIELAKDVNGGELIKKLKTFLPVNSKVLEIGSGPGTDWKILSQDYNVTGSDNSEVFLKHLISKNPKGTFKLLDAVSLNTKDKFDGIYSNKVLHHLKDSYLTQSVKRQHEILNNNGIICHSFWKGEGSEIFKGLFVNYHTADTLKAYFEPYFDILAIEEYTEFDAGDSIVFIGKKKNL